jgi:ATP-dependent DNA helicase PIF1
MARNGTRWSAEDEAYLRDKVHGSPLGELASALERSQGAVRWRLMQFAAAEGGDAPACDKYGVTEEQVREFTLKRDGEALARAAAGQATTRAAERPLAAPVATVRLTASQQRALEAVQAGGHVCVTGPAGTGKSTLLARVREWAADTGRCLGITATTGCAALLVGGRTLHSYLGIGLGALPAAELAAATRRKFPNVAGKLRCLDTLVVDEISMADAELLDKVSAYLQLLRGSDAPFGSVQMVFIGDFCQLPPVTSQRAGAAANFAFMAKDWARAAPTVVVLDEIVRQQADPAFAAMLCRLRWGEVSREDLDTLRACKDRTFPEGIKPTVLYALNRDVERVNQAGLEALKVAGARPFVLRAALAGKDKARVAAFAKACDISEALELAVGAQVMVTANVDMDAGIVNGTRAVVEDYFEAGRANAATERVALRLVSGRRYFLSRHKVAMDETKEAQATVSYFPLKLAFAMSVHKSQAATLDAVEVDLGPSIFEHAQAYVALSRARSLDCVRVTDVHPASFKAHQSAVDFYRQHGNHEISYGM